MRKITNIEKTTNFKYLNLYKVTYDIDKRKLDYYVASRREKDELSCIGSKKVDAVRIIPYFVSNAKTYVVLIREFRYAINDYIYAVPAGLVDEGETEIESAKRELEEEVGAKVINIVQTEKASYSSAGMSDEKLSCFEAEVELGGSQALGDFEDIEVKIVALEDLEKFIDENHFGLQTALQLRAFIYKKELEKYKK